MNRYDDVNHLLSLTYTDADDSLLAEYLYEVDGVGNRQVVTETLYAPGVMSTIEAYLEADGLVVMEAEKGATAPGASGHEWLNQTAQTGYEGSGYLRAMPDVGELYETAELNSSPRLTYQLQNSTPATYTVWVRGMAPDAAGDSLHVGINDQPVAAAGRLTGLTNEWSWSRLTMDNAPATVPLTTTGNFTVKVWMREDGLRIDRLLLVTDTNYIPSGMGPAESLIQVVTDTVAPGFTSHVIHYTYDDVYRLTDAIYTGDITATYKYTYDPVGNMTAYTEILNTQTTRVTRYFDDANRLQDSFDYDAGTTSYLYDNNGNLTLIIPPDGGNWLHYGYDQRNLMITHTLSVSGTNPQLQAAYAYDGAGSRVQQVDYTGTSPVTTIYANDIAGLTQVLVADDGTEQVYNLFGLDLIGQDEGTNTRYLLADGLGSVRTEMVDGNVESVTTYDPYGNLLTQTGNSGTTYGYTGEQYDDATGLLYLRARYYNPALRSFMGRDPWSGDMKRPQSMNGWGYVEGNPINLMDPTGQKPFPDDCRDAPDVLTYAKCIRKYYGVEPPDVNGLEVFYYGAGIISKYKGCWSGEVPYRAPGYLEGWSVQFGVFLNSVGGEEIVYDFATMERQVFTYDGTSWTPTIGLSAGAYAGRAYGLRSWSTLENDYKGKFGFFYLGYGVSIIPLPILPFFSGIGPSGGVLLDWGIPDNSVGGQALYVSLGGGFNFLKIGPGSVDVGGGTTYYTPQLTLVSANSKVAMAKT